MILRCYNAAEWTIRDLHMHSTSLTLLGGPNEKAWICVNVKHCCTFEKVERTDVHVGVGTKS